MNARQHFAIGVGVGLVLNLLKQGVQMQLDPTRKFKWLELAGYGAIGGTIALVPDMIEPASHPNHRAFFHSATCGGIAVYAPHGEHAQKWEPAARHLAQSVCWCYVSHLEADATTPKSLRFI